MTSTTLHRCRGDHGSAPVEAPLAVGLLLLPIVILVLMLPQWPERQTIATSAAKEAASLYANAANATVGEQVATDAVAQAAANAGFPGGLDVAFTGEWCRTCEVTAAVTVEIPAIDMPFVGGVGALHWTASSTARVDDFRSIEPETP